MLYTVFVIVEFNKTVQALGFRSTTETLSWFPVQQSWEPVWNYFLVLWSKSYVDGEVIFGSVIFFGMVMT